MTADDLRAIDHLLDRLIDLLPRLAVVCEKCEGRRSVVHVEEVRSPRVHYTNREERPCSACEGRGFTRLGALEAKVAELAGVRP